MSAPNRRTPGCAGSGTLAFLVAVALLPTSGCSFLFLDRPKDDYGPFEKINCTTGYALPVMDTVLTLLHVISIATLQSSSGDAFGGQKSRDGLTQFDLSWMIFEGGSAIWGYYKVNQCNELIASHAPHHWQRPTTRPTTRPVEPGIEPVIEPRTSPPPMPPSDAEPSPTIEPTIEPPPRAPAPGPAAPPPAPPAPPVRQQVDQE